MAENRRQHYVPEFMLAGFTDSGDRESQLFALDQETGVRWRARPIALAHQRDLYRIDVADTDPNLFEKTFGAFEGDVSEAVRALVQSQEPPTGKALQDLMFFVALMAVRIPARRARRADEIDRMAKMMMRMSVSTPERWEATKRRMQADGVSAFPDASYEEVKALFESDDFTIDFPQTWHVAVLYESATTIYPYLAGRRWVYFRADQDAGDFICSDYPVGLVWASGETESFFPPGFALHGTEVTMPLTRRWAMLGSFEGAEGVYRATPMTVASINSRSGMYARQLYSAQEDFALIKRGGGIGTSADLLAWIAAQKGIPPAAG